MPQSRNENRIKLDLNNEIFQRNWLGLEKAERERVTTALSKLIKLTWDQLYRDSGFKWEKITSIKPLPGIDAIYSLRITQSRRATALRDGNWLRMLTIEPDHDSAYGKR